MFVNPPRAIQRLTITYFLVFCFGCTPRVDFARAGIPTALPHKNSELGSIYKKEAETLNTDNNPEIGLALSGGGIRSAMYCIGAMKALYDLDDGKFFETIDVISSVSGGGYASYWLYSHEINDPGLGFGEAALSDEHYGENLRNLAAKSDMYPWERMLAEIFHSRSHTVQDYEDQIDYTFGFSSPKEERLLLSDLRKLVKERQVPIPVINTTISATKQSSRVPRNFEFSPTHFGNQEVGFENHESAEEFRMSKAVAISGAAFAPLLYQEYKNWKNETYPEKWPLTDGGHNENLGALALIRRGVKNIFIIDAEHSPKYSFGAYDQLKLNLKELGLHLHIKNIEEWKKVGYNDRANLLPCSIATGTISPINNSNPSESITVVYLKMSLTKEMENKIHEIANSADGFKDVLDDFKNCSLWNSSEQASQLSEDDFCLKTIGTYSKWLNKDSKFRFLGRVLKSAQYSFPQTSTIDQEFQYCDQMSAFLALGYLQGKKLWAEIN
jgi:hypothetical protein